MGIYAVCASFLRGHGHHVEFCLVGIFLQCNDSNSRALGSVSAMAFVVNQTEEWGVGEQENIMNPRVDSSVGLSGRKDIAIINVIVIVIILLLRVVVVVVAAAVAVVVVVVVVTINGHAGRILTFATVTVTVTVITITVIILIVY